jgi:beta-lactamase regulating signal transducer with metallopeptidase domain
VSGCVDVIASDHPIALCHGLWRPRIWLSTGALAVLGPAELRALLGHERVHRRRRDPLRLLVARAVAAAFPHLPVLRELAATLPVAQELAADRAVIRAGARDALGRALLTIVEGNGALEMPALATGMVSCLDARIDQLTGAPVVLPRLSRRALVRTGVALGGGLLLLLVLAASRPPTAPPGPPPIAHGNPPIGAPVAPGP